MPIEKLVIAGGIEPLALTIEQTQQATGKSTLASAPASTKPSRPAGER